ncbi:hypothetical protein SAMN02910291_02890 [Desulfovibrio desulfuricans]|uniref:Uncharacterized protein n=1 Tax=Desulfovibrio desulfuricans TaxID=876 RepID=A0AA94L3L1_DESDE|nr:hypothetical protein CNY67_12280 [Desulfovibrio sp. G11]SFW74814.1 hypothetical protein SAMN02910291_02890 [Desulfovibrio desulfuricans]SPD34818.1 Hypothetical protein DSVG11_0704 [Desulfovibrio sp. G11]
MAFATSISYETQKHADIEINSKDFKKEIIFTSQDMNSFSNLVNKYFPMVVEDCIIMDMKKTLYNIMDGGDIANFFPIKDSTVIKKILKERLRVIFKILTKPQGQFDHLFDTDISDELILPIINKFFNDTKVTELNKDTYSTFTYSSVKNIMKLSQDIKFINILKQLSAISQMKF